MPFDFGKTKGSAARKGSFLSQAAAAPDPLASVEYTGNVAEDSASELTALKDQGFDQRRRNEANRFKQATDSEFWFAVCFESREQKETFLAALPNAKRLGDKYIDGKALATSMGISLD